MNITVADFTNDKQMKNYMFGSSGINNIAISSHIIEQMAHDPAAVAKYEKVIADVPRAGEEIKAAVEAAGNEHLASGTIIDKNGNVSYWGVGSKRDDLNSNKVSNKEKLQKQLEEKRAKKKEEEAAKKKRLERAETLEKLLEKIKAGKSDNEFPAKEANKNQACSVTISREGLEKLKQNSTSNTMGVEKADQYRSILS